MSDKDDFESDDFDLDGFDDGFDDLNSEQGTLGDLWRNNPFVKIGVILFVLALIIGLFILFGGKKEDPVRSRIASISDVTETPGTDQVSETMRTAIEEDNTRRLEEALRNDESTVPMPVTTGRGQIPFELEKPEEEDPLERWRRLQEEKIERAAQQPVPERNEPDVDTRTPAINELSKAMSQQMESILNNQGIKGANIKNIAKLEFLEGLTKKQRDLEAAERKRQSELLASRGDGNGRDDDDDNAILLPAGTIEYAQMLTEANTDVPGPILAQIVTGPFKGARIIGSFEESYDYLTLNFDTIVLDGVDYSANGVAIDTKTTLPGLATDIDRRYFKRVILPMAAEFISGFAEAVSDSGTTTVTVSGDTTTETTSNDRDNDQEVASGIATAGRELSSVIQEIKENNPPLLRVRAGTPIGILFVESVTNDEDEEVTGPYQQLQNFQLRGNPADANSQ